MATLTLQEVAKKELERAFLAEFGTSAIFGMSSTVGETNGNVIEFTRDTIPGYTIKDQDGNATQAVTSDQVAILQKALPNTQSYVVTIKNEWIAMGEEKMRDRIARAAQKAVQKRIANIERNDYFGTIKAGIETDAPYDVTVADEIHIPTTKRPAILSVLGDTLTASTGKEIVALLQDKRTSLKTIVDEFQDVADAQDYIIFADSNWTELMGTDLAFANNAISTDLISRGFKSVVGAITNTEVVMADRMGTFDYDASVAANTTGVRKVKAIIMRKDAAAAKFKDFGSDVLPAGNGTSLNKNLVAEYRAVGLLTKAEQIIIITE